MENNELVITSLAMSAQSLCIDPASDILVLLLKSISTAITLADLLYMFEEDCKVFVHNMLARLSTGLVYS